jgi:hypothetical protein
MYSNEKYLHTFDNGVKEMILLQTRTQWSEPIFKKGKMLHFPDISEVITGTDFNYKEILNSKPVN